ncbi:hypothetical protein HPG69_017270, partial [Diceros bicornis minor]
TVKLDCKINSVYFICPIVIFPLDRSFDVIKSRHPAPFLAAGRLSDMLNGGHEVYANCMVTDQVGDLAINYINIEGITTNTHPEPVGSALGPQSGKHILPTGAGAGMYPLSESKEVTWSPEARQSFRSPASSYASNLNLSFGLHEFEKEQSCLKKRSSSLDALDADSEGEGLSEQSHLCYAPVSPSSSRTGIPSGDELDSFETTAEPDFNISRTESLSLSSNLQSKESLLSGIRSRSYSCSSPKISLGKTQLVRDFTVCNSSEEQRAYSLPEPPREKRTQEEEWDKYIIPAKSESEKYKVSRTFSFLMNRMTNPRNKSKVIKFGVVVLVMCSPRVLIEDIEIACMASVRRLPLSISFFSFSPTFLLLLLYRKTKSKDAKDKEKLSRHHFVPGTFSGVLQCSVCDKTLLGKESFQCSSKFSGLVCCLCTWPPQTSFQINLNKMDAFPFVVSDCNVNVHKGCKDAAPPCTKKYQEKYNKNKPQTILGRSVNVGVGVCVRLHFWLFFSKHTSDVVDSSLWSDLSSDAQEFEAESWSLVVDPLFCSRQEKDVIKRQDVIFELMQTEMHHIQTLFIMSEIFRKGMKEELQLDHSTVDKIFPCLDELLEIHRHFFYSMKERRQESCDGDDRNFIINRIGDILVQQKDPWYSEKGFKAAFVFLLVAMLYGIILLQILCIIKFTPKKKIQVEFVYIKMCMYIYFKLRNSNLLARRRGIPECILLVTQRITKYPVLVERILQYTKERTEEHQDLCKALCLIKDMIAAVDLKVSEYEKNQKWLEILSKIENKTYTKLKNGHVFRKQALLSEERTLLHDGLVYWKTATGRFKDILALLLTDVLLFLQEKDQKYIFASVDQKPSVISLQKLIAREVANEERGMFLISASSAGPEMYEIHTNSKEERNNWMRRIQQAVESCPEEEGGRTSDSDEEKRKAEARVARIQHCQEILSNQDQQICMYLEEKLSIYAELGQLSGFEDVHLEPHLLIKPDPGEPPQAASLLAAALKEAESLQVAVKASQMGDACLSSEEGCGESALTDTLSSQDVPGLPTASLDAEGAGGRNCWDVDPGIQGVGTDVAVSDAGEKAALTIQDSHIEIHKLVLQQQESLSPSPSFQGSPLQDQEKHRSLEKPREELADVPQLQHQLQQDQRRWHRTCDQQQREQEAKACRLQERERECRSREELLLRGRGELDRQLREYRQSLERLRAGQRLVQRERERLRAQRSLPAALAPGSAEVMEFNQSESLCHENSFFINETLVQMSLNTFNKPTPSDIHWDATYPPNISNSDSGLRSAVLGNSLKKSLLFCLVRYRVHMTGSDQWKCEFLKQGATCVVKPNVDISQLESPPPHDSDPHSPQLQTFIAEAKLSLQTATRHDGETGDRAEENIVYL